MYKSVHDQLLEAECQDREGKVSRWRDARLNDLAMTMREIGHKLAEEYPNHPAHDYISSAEKLLREVR